MKKSRKCPTIIFELAKYYHYKKLGYNEGIVDRRQRVCFHTLRHTYASWAVMAGVPIFIVAKALGHKTIAMTQRYSHLAPDSHRVAFEAVAKYQENSLLKGE